jgi:putative colanic acid biosynthesis glycosyltransferase
MKTLLQINTVVNMGSTGHIVEEIGQMAIQNGWNSYIAFGRNERPSKSKLIKIGTKIDIKLHGLQTRFFDRHGLGSKRATIEFIEKVIEIKPDIIHLHNLHGYYLNIKILFDYLSTIDIPIVLTLHDCWTITGHCTHFDFINCQKWKTACNHCPQKKEYPASLLFDRSKKNYLLKKKLFNSIKNMTIVPVSQWLGKIITQSFISKYPIQIINNGIDTKIFVNVKDQSIRTKYNIENKFIILGVANIWNVRKGLLDFIELSKLIDNDCIIILVGLNSKQYKNLPNNIIGISRTENTQKLAELYSTADVFLNPTWEDNFPTTNLEALSCGTPVITYNTGGSIESVCTNTGFIVEKKDITGLIKSINTVRKIGKEYYSDNCIKRANWLYNKNDRYLDYINLYTSMINQ